jgi:hypothetical protein
MNTVIQGLQILGKYCDPDNVCGMCAEHDVIYAAPDIREHELAVYDSAKLKELGWEYEDGVGWRLNV